MQKQRKSSQETIVGPSSSSRDLHTSISLSSSAGTKGPTLVEDGNFKLNTVNTRFLEHHPVTSPPANQKKVTHPAALTPNFAFRSFSLKTIREFRVFEHKTPILLAWPCNKPFSAPSSNVLVCLASLCVGHTNLGSVILTQHCKSTILKLKKKKKLINLASLMPGSILKASKMWIMGRVHQYITMGLKIHICRKTTVEILCCTYIH